jgi:CheY-like chemotaxis protein
MEARSQGRQKMEALGTLAGGVAHDFNNLLTVILGNAEMIAADVPEGSDPAAFADAIRTAAVRARDVVRRILLFSRPEAETRKSIALATVMDETVQLLQTTLPSSIRLVWQRPARPITAIGDASQLTQVLMNLGVNASHALPDARGTIEFGLDRVELGPVAAHALGLQSGPYAQITVRDDGMGMSEEVRGRIFEPFFTTKPVGKGSGLGLSVVEGVVRGHRGGIEVESAIGEGTAFRLYLPASEAAASTPAPAVSPPVPTRAGGGQRVLLLDDDPMVLMVESEVLRRAGYEVTAHGDVDDALAALAADLADYAILVTDRSMPKLSGLDVARRARQLNPRLPIVLLTGRSEPGDAESPYLSEVVGKPADAPVLLGAIERAIAGAGHGGDCANRVAPPVARQPITIA